MTCQGHQEVSTGPVRKGLAEIDGMLPVPGRRPELVGSQVPDTQVEHIVPFLVTKQRPARPGCQVTAEEIVTALAEITH